MWPDNKTCKCNADNILLVFVDDASIEELQRLRSLSVQSVDRGFGNMIDAKDALLSGQRKRNKLKFIFDYYQGHPSKYKLLK